MILPFSIPDRRMDWMVQSEEASREDYLLGKKIESTDDLALLDDASKRYYRSEVDDDILERTAHQDMLTKMHEDPLYLIKWVEFFFLALLAISMHELSSAPYKLYDSS